MNRFYEKCLAALLTVLLIASTVSCNKPNGSQDISNSEVTTAITEEIIQTDEYGREIIRHSVPGDLDYEGADIVFLVRDYEGFTIDIGVEAQDGDIVHDAVFNRNSRTSEDLNINIVMQTAENTNTATSETVGDKLRAAVFAGDTSYDVVAVYQFYGGSSLAIEGMLYNLNNIKYLNFEKPWWNQDFVDTLNIKGQLYNFVGSMNLSVISSNFGVFFNQNKFNDYYKGYTFLYENVYDGIWTLDRMIELTQDVYSDINGDGISDMGDFFGMRTVEDDPGPWPEALGIRRVTKDSSGTPQLTFFSEKTIDAYSKLYNFYKNTTGVYFGAKGYDYRQDFVNGGCLIAIAAISTAETHLRNMEEAYGMLPMPKYDENQDTYHNTSRDSANIMGVASNTTKPDAVGAALELLNYYAYQDVIPAYYEIVMKTKYLADSDSANMFDLLLNGSSIDFGQVYSLAISGGKYTMEGTFHVLMRNLVRLNIEDIASHYAKYEPVYQAVLQTIIDAYEVMAE